MTTAVLAWGLGQAVPEDADSAWGCRAIVDQDGMVDIPPDRQDVRGTSRILEVLAEEFPVVELRLTLSALLRSGDMHTRIGENFVLYQNDDATTVVVANTLGSAGYCYVAAWTCDRKDTA